MQEKGNQGSRLHVEARLNQLGEGGVDTVRLSRTRSAGCCWRRRTIASFTFRGGAEEGTKPLVSDKVASLKVGRLATKDPETPIRVEYLAGNETVFCQEMTLKDLLAGLRRTSRAAGRHAVLVLCLVRGQDVRGGQGKGCPILFCNGKRVGSPELPQKDQAVPVPKAGKEAGPISEAGQVGANPERKAGPAEAGQVETSLARPSSPGQEADPTEAGQMGSSPGSDGLGLCISAPTSEERQEEEQAGGRRKPR
ncbi:hypothetical protein E2C01_016475 [Portunus trituberculatus]|uniref:Uncharacterized protein n=1 Tax=Portunus trituberculatus TaxID=210409 RepID=A0A5B7DPQ0_PORTR|nr:hypothetical protein [Portunus trituberculatus]